MSPQETASRAIAIFDEALRLGQFRWGKKALKTAGAAIIIARRECRLSDAGDDIARLLSSGSTDVESAHLDDAVREVVHILKLKVEPADPSHYFDFLRSRLLQVLSQSSEDGDDAIKSVHRQVLASVNMEAVSLTASSLCALLFRLPGTPLLRSQACLLACAAWLTALEGETKAPLPNAMEFAGILASYFDHKSSTVMERYRLIQTLAEQWSRTVPWLDQYELGGGKKSKTKPSKRKVVARALKDIIQFQDDIWIQKSTPLCSQQLSKLISEEESMSSSTPSTAGDTETIVFSTSTGDRSPVLNAKRLRPVDLAYAFLLNPAANSAAAVDDALSSTYLPYLLTSSSASGVSAPTRLQVLCASRGGNHHVLDDELFSEEEWNGLWRSQQEMDVLQKLHADEWDTVKPAKEATSRPSRGAARLNADALARIFGSSIDEEGKEDDIFSVVVGKSLLQMSDTDDE